MSNKDIKGKTALVTGASSGLGADFARDLAKRGSNLILVARREDLLQNLKQELSSQHGIQVEIIAQDLTGDDAPQILFDKIKSMGKSVDILINNAGFAVFGEFVKIPWERERNMLELDILTVVHMTKLFAQDMLTRDYGYILNVASIGAYQPSPTYATYSAAKSFVRDFSEAISYELRKTKVKICAISPGYTKTEFLQVSGQKATLYQRVLGMNSPDVTRIGINNMLKGRPNVVPGAMNAFLAWSTRLMPRRMAAATAYRTMTMN